MPNEVMPSCVWQRGALPNKVLQKALECKAKLCGALQNLVLQKPLVVQVQVQNALFEQAKAGNTCCLTGKITRNYQYYTLRLQRFEE